MCSSLLSALSGPWGPNTRVLQHQPTSWGWLSQHHVPGAQRLEDLHAKTENIPLFPYGSVGPSSAQLGFAGGKRNIPPKGFSFCNANLVGFFFGGSGSHEG